MIRRDKRSRKHHPIRAVGVEASFVTASAQHPERTKVREECEHCRGRKWQVSQARKEQKRLKCRI
ncbi:MAG TPA: hypothetical protein DEO73_03780 [Pantoea sp.]|nr:hypothetical protein [Pantoea sp.]